MTTSSQNHSILLAIQAVTRNKTLSRRKAAAIYNVPESSLCDRMNGRTSRRDCHRNLRKWMDTEESAVVRYMLDLDARGFSPDWSGLKIWPIDSLRSVMANASGSAGRKSSLSEVQSSGRALNGHTTFRGSLGRSGAYWQMVRTCAQYAC